MLSLTLQKDGGIAMAKKLVSFILAAAVAAGSAVIPISAAADGTDKLPAFPGALGGGKYTQGARGANDIEVYHVTNLNDSGEGSLRDAISEEGRIVVFDVGGVIKLNSQLQFRKDNVTVLGQTAPGDGITITGNDVLINDHVSDIIIRYIRVRPSDDSGGEPDGIGGRWVSNVILDHCSISWSVDEALTLYAGSLEESPDVSENITVQYCITSESMRMSNHIKGAHGYGGIVGGTNASYVNNLFAHHDSRSPRFDRNLKATDFTNNVIYNWGNTNSLYGAEPYSYSSKPEFSTPEYASNVNLVNNYYKYGPSTRVSLRSRIFDVSNDDNTLKSNFYVSGNYVDGNASVTADNSRGVNNSSKANLLDAPVDMGEYTVTAVSAEEAYTDVLANAGATLPKRDSLDARVIADVENGTGRILNNDEEIGGLTGIEESEAREFVIPEDWKAENSMGSAAPEDIAPSGYTWIEEYVNDWTAEQSAPTNPDITVESPAVAYRSMSQDVTGKMGSWTVISETEPLEYKMTASAADGTEVVKTELWDGETRLREYDGAAMIDDDISLAPGTHYIFSRAYNDKGEKTDSPTSIVYVTGTGAVSGTVTEIGSAADAGGTLSYPGKGAAWTQGDSTYISGSGLIGGKADSCSYMYYPVDGDFEYIVRTADIPKYENGVMAGIMFRETLDPGSRMVMVSDSWFRYGENVIMPMRTAENSEAKFEWMRDRDGKEIANNGSYDVTKYPVPRYLKISREGDAITVSVSNNGYSWDGNIRQPYGIQLNGLAETGYIGIACDSVNGQGISESGNKKGSIPMLPWYTISGFSDISGVNVEGVPTPEPTPSIPAYEDYNELPTTEPLENGTFLNVTELWDGAYTATKTELLFNGRIRAYGTTSNEILVEDYGNAELEDGTKFNKRLRLKGKSSFTSLDVPQQGVIELMPKEDSIITVYFYKTGGGVAELAMMQEGEELVSGTDGSGVLSSIQHRVKGGSRVYIHSPKQAVGILGIRLEEAEHDTDYGISAPSVDSAAGKVSFTVESYVNMRREADAIVVIKDADGRLLSVTPQKVEFDGAGTVTVNADCGDVLEGGNAEDISLLLWDGVNTMKPLDAEVIE